MQEEPTTNTRPKCPTCGEPMLQAIWGLPSGPPEPGEIQMGCLVDLSEPMPEYVCATCD